MAGPLGSMPTLPRDVARSKPLDEAESERTANALRVRRMRRQILLEELDDAPVACPKRSIFNRNNIFLSLEVFLYQQRRNEPAKRTGSMMS